MFTRAEAVIAVEEHINRDAGADDTLVVLEDATLEYDFGWVFFFDSRRHADTGNFEDLLVGNAPIIFEKATGMIVTTGTAEPVESYVHAYRKSGNPHAQLDASVRIWGWNEGAVATQAMKVLRAHATLGLAEVKQRIDHVLQGGEVTVATSSVEAAREATVRLQACHFLAEQLYDAQAADVER